MSVALAAASHISRAQLFSTPWTAAYQAPPSMGFSRQEYWSGVPVPSPDEQLSIYKLWGPSKKSPFTQRDSQAPGGPPMTLSSCRAHLAESSLALSVWPIKHGVSHHMPPPRLWRACGYHLGSLSGVTVSQRSHMWSLPTSVPHGEEPELHANGPHEWAWREVFQLQ